jgi:S1-C subfamily serine protease
MTCRRGAAAALLALACGGAPAQPGIPATSPATPGPHAGTKAPRATAVPSAQTSPSPQAATPAPGTPPAAAEPPAEAASAPVSLSARKVYEQARTQLVQIRTLLKGRASQTSVGSGFFVSPEGHIVTNFHVVSEAALKPERHDLVYVTADGREAPVTILQIDVLHDLALLKAVDAKGRAFDALTFRTEARPLAQGERIYSLGNPLDVGFAVAEGTYNGVVRRSFYPTIFFGGALSAGMSGGPALDQEGQVVGINVARRVDGEQVSFLVPAPFAAALLARGRDTSPIRTPAYDVVDQQLLVHQQTLTERFIKQGWKSGTHPRYSVPVPPDVFMRCWGSSEPSRTGGLDVERSDCAMDTRVFVGDFTTGTISLRHESYDGAHLGPLRFAARYSQSFRNESFVRLSTEHQTRPQCHEDYVDRNGLALRAVVCMRAYKKLPQLYDVAVLVATLDQSQAGVQGRMDAQGVSFENAQRLSRHYIEGYGWAH